MKNITKDVRDAIRTQVIKTERMSYVIFNQIYDQIRYPIRFRINTRVKHLIRWKISNLTKGAKE